MTMMWPPRAFCAAGQSQGSQKMATVPGPPGMTAAALFGKNGHGSRLFWGTLLFKHNIENYAYTVRSLRSAGRCGPLPGKGPAGRSAGEASLDSRAGLSRPPGGAVR